MVGVIIALAAAGKLSVADRSSLASNCSTLAHCGRVLPGLFEQVRFRAIAIILVNIAAQGGW
jgi:hypothetical protein